MVFIGLVLLFAGVIMNFKVLKRPYPARGDAGNPNRRQVTTSDMLSSPPWLISAGLVAAGLLIVIVFH